MRRNLTKADRIKKRSDIRRIFSVKKRVQCSGARLLFIENGLDRTRFMVSLIRHYGNAVERNYAKRIAREIFRTGRHSIKSGYDIVLILFPGSYSFQKRKEQFRYLCSKADLCL